MVKIHFWQKHYFLFYFAQSRGDGEKNGKRIGIDEYLKLAYFNVESLTK